ncbi:MAG: TRAP transporter substrate-binding protein [Rhabdaerophilum sp.]
MKIRSFGASLLVTVAATTFASAQSLPPGPPIKLNVVTQPGPQFPQYTRVDVPLIKEGLQQKSGGRITVDLASWPERSLNGPEIIRYVRAGQVEIGAAPLNTVSGNVPLLDLVDLAGLNPTVEQARKMADILIPEVNKALEKTGTRIIATYPFAAQVFFCRDKVSNLADLKGKRIRSSGGSVNDFLKAIDAQAISVGFPEVYGALERGVADCAITGTSSGNSARWYEVTQSLYALPVAWAVSAYFVNAAWWDGLDPAVRDMIAKTMKEVEDAQWKLGLETTDDGIACNTGVKANCKIGKVVENKPMTVYLPSAADQATLRKTLVETMLPSWVKRCGEACGEIYNRIAAPISGVKYEAK